MEGDKASCISLHFMQSDRLVFGQEGHVDILEIRVRNSETADELDNTFQRRIDKFFAHKCRSIPAIFSRNHPENNIMLGIVTYIVN